MARWLPSEAVHPSGAGHRCCVGHEARVACGALAARGVLPGNGERPKRALDRQRKGGCVCCCRTRVAGRAPAAGDYHATAGPCSWLARARQTGGIGAGVPKWACQAARALLRAVHPEGARVALQRATVTVSACRGKQGCARVRWSVKNYTIKKIDLIIIIYIGQSQKPHPERCPTGMKRTTEICTLAMY